MKTVSSDPGTYPPVNSWVWRSDHIPHRVARRLKKSGDPYLTLSTPAGDLTIPPERITGWVDWQSDRSHIYRCDFRIKGTDRTYRLMGLFDVPFPAGLKVNYDTWAKLKSSNGSIAYWRIDQLEYCDRSVLPIPQFQPRTEVIAA